MTRNEISGGDWESRPDSFEAAADVAIPDGDVCFLQSNFPSGVRDWVLHLRTDNHIRIANPIELLGTDTACQLLHATHQRYPDLATQFTFSRLLVQCLEYRGNSRHLVVEPWSERDLRGETFFENNRTQLARDFGVEQAHSFKLFMSGQKQSEKSREEVYWGTFSALPKVEDSFEDEELKRFAVQLSLNVLGEKEGDTVVEMSSFKKQVKGLWKNYFSEFELDTVKRQRRKLYDRLLSVAVRQSSSLMRQIAYTLLLKGMPQKDHASFEFTRRESKLFEIRYGSHAPLGNINIGFLHEYDEHHADLLNELGRALVCDTPDQQIQVAEQKLFRSVQLLDEYRESRKEIRKDQRRQTRQNKQKKPPKDTRWERVEPVDTREKAPDARLEIHELLEGAKLILDYLKPRCRQRVQALIAADADWAKAAAAESVDERKFQKRFMETTVPNIETAIKRKKQRDNQY